ncbi:MAG: hypothetical protein IKY01_11565 [Prevotella sp.]|nr:hypothetical protein [Prevotella sp.]
MKKVLVMVAVAMMTAMSVNAQSGYEDTKHEVGISYGALSNTTWMSIADAMGTTITLGAVKYSDGNFTGPIAVEYFYHLSPVIGLGAIGAYTHETKDILISNDKYGEAKNTFFTVMPAAKFNWLRKKNFGMYSKVGAGLTFASKKEDYSKGSVENLSESKVGFNFQVSALGIEAGSETIRAFVELGVGEQGVALVGVRLKF